MPKFRYAEVVATLALFVALGGTGYAVTKLPRNSVGSREVRDHSLKRADLAASALAAPVRGPRGPEGPAGPGGATGPIGPANVLNANTQAAVPFRLNGPSSIDVVTLRSVPAGSWLFVASGSAVFADSGSDFFRCSLAFGDTAGAAASVARIGSDSFATAAGDLIVHEGRVLTEKTDVRFRCGHDLNLSGTPRMDHAQITAIRTQDLTTQTGT